jgi:hypothetical protein
MARMPKITPNSPGTAMHKARIPHTSEAIAMPEVLVGAVIWSQWDLEGTGNFPYAEKLSNPPAFAYCKTTEIL